MIFNMAFYARWSLFTHFRPRDQSVTYETEKVYWAWKEVSIILLWMINVLLCFSFSSRNLSFNILQTTDDSDSSLCVALYFTRYDCFEVEVNPL